MNDAAAVAGRPTGWGWDLALLGLGLGAAWLPWVHLPTLGWIASGYPEALLVSLVVLVGVPGGWRGATRRGRAAGVLLLLWGLGRWLEISVPGLQLPPYSLLGNLGLTSLPAEWAPAALRFSPAALGLATTGVGLLRRHARPLLPRGRHGGLIGCATLILGFVPHAHYSFRAQWVPVARLCEAVVPGTSAWEVVVAARAIDADDVGASDLADREDETEAIRVLRNFVYYRVLCTATLDGEDRVVSKRVTSLD